MTICMLPIAGRLLTDSLFSIVIVVLVHTMVLKVGDFACSVLPIAGRPATIKRYAFSYFSTNR